MAIGISLDRLSFGNDALRGIDRLTSKGTAPIHRLII